jgi:carboxylesterase
MRHLGGRLAARGFHVVAPVLAGHGRTAEDLDRTTWSDWVQSALAEVDRIPGPLAVVGMSLGGLLALHLTHLRRDRIVAVGSLGAPLWLPWLSKTAIRIVHRLKARIPSVPKRGGPDVRDPITKAANPSLAAFPANATKSLLDFTGIVRDEVPKIDRPAFVAHANGAT